MSVAGMTLHLTASRENARSVVPEITVTISCLATLYNMVTQRVGCFQIHWRIYKC